MLIAIILFIVFVSILTITHELGHFLGAKLTGVGVEKFAIGFPPKVWSKKFGETEFSINALPFGGYVLLVGEGNEEVKTPNSFNSKTPFQQFIILVSGVLMNLLVGILLLWLAFTIGTQPIFPGTQNYAPVTNTQRVVIDGVEKNTPAEAAGLTQNDVILKIDGKSVSQDSEVVNEVQSKVNNQGATVNLVIQRDGKELEKTISTYKSKVKTNKGEIEVNRIGIILSTKGNVRANVFNSLIIAVRSTINIVAVTIIGIFNLFKLILTQFKLSQDVSGPVGIILYTNYFAKLGFTAFLQFMAAISITLAVFNILPIPALDGGQILFTLIEVVSRRKLSMKIKNIVQTVGFGLLILLMVAVTIKDLINIF